MNHKERQARPRGKNKLKRQLPFYLMALPGFVYLMINNYIPLSGVVIAFKKLNLGKGIWASKWVGFDNFKFLFASKDAFTITRNTIAYNVVGFILGTFLSILLAILINEIRSKQAKKAYQTIILLPFLMSWVIISYLAYIFLSTESGLFNNAILKPLGLKSVNWYQSRAYWPFILVFANAWKGVGYSMIIYLSGIVGISEDYYDAARIDGAGKIKQITSITLPLLKPTIITLSLFALGGIFRSDFGLYYQLPKDNGALYPVTRTLDVYIYQMLMTNNDFSRSSAASLYQSLVGFLLIVSANALVRKYQKNSALF